MEVSLQNDPQNCCLSRTRLFLSVTRPDIILYIEKEALDLVLEGVLEQQARHHVGVDVGGGAAVLEVAVALELDGQRDADRRAAVGNA